VTSRDVLPGDNDVAGGVAAENQRRPGDGVFPAIRQRDDAPAVFAVTFPPLASAFARSMACGTLIACTYWVLPLRRSSTKSAPALRPPPCRHAAGGRFGTQAHTVDEDVGFWNCLGDDDLPVWQRFQLRVFGENTWNGERMAQLGSAPSSTSPCGSVISARPFQATPCTRTPVSVARP